MRITKKYAGSSSIGKQLFQPCDNFHDVQDQIRGIETELARLEIIFLAKIHSKLPSSDKLALTPEPPLRKGVNSSPGALDQTDQEDSGSNGSHPKLRLLNFEALSDGKMKPKLIGPHTSMNISGSILMDKSKRTLSAPNLQHLVPIKDKSAVLSMPLASSSSTKDDQSVLKPNYSSSKKTIGWKRSRSVMALMDFEKLVADDQAAGNSCTSPF